MWDLIFSNNDIRESYLHVNRKITVDVIVSSPENLIRVMVYDDFSNLGEVGKALYLNANYLGKNKVSENEFLDFLVELGIKTSLYFESGSGFIIHIKPKNQQNNLSLTFLLKIQKYIEKNS